MSGRSLIWEVGDGRAKLFPVVEEDGRWLAELPNYRGTIPVPGARPMTIREFVGGRFRMTQRYGDWIEIDREISRSDRDLLDWCRRRCNSELPSGTFRIAPKIWEEHAEEGISRPFLPELDHPSQTIRALAAAERHRRQAEHDLRASQSRRDGLIRAAGSEGNSRRELAALLGISFGRVQQVTHAGESGQEQS